jgi:aromatic ring-opening dioxygenase catalytic subunit (LigB family)
VSSSRVLLVPHLPTLLMDEHRRHHTPMLEALEREAARLFEQPPAIVVVLSARWVSTGPFHVDTSRRHRTLTDYTGFGVEVRYDCPGHPALARALVEAGVRADVRVGACQRGVDSGVTVPLHFLLPRKNVPVVPLSLAPRPADECRAWGAVVRAVCDARPERIAVVVSGLLSNDEHAWSFRREVPEARVFDEHALEALGAGAWDRLSPTDAQVIERAHPQAELRHLEVLRGFLGSDLPGQVICYETAPGVGAALVAFELAADGSEAPPASPERESLAKALAFSAVDAPRAPLPRSRDRSPEPGRRPRARVSRPRRARPK